KNSVHCDDLPCSLYDGLGHDGPLLGRASGVKSLAYLPIVCNTFPGSCWSHWRLIPPIVLTSSHPRIFKRTQERSMLKQIDAGVLKVGYVEYGAPKGSCVVLLHGFPL